MDGRIPTVSDNDNENFRSLIKKEKATCPQILALAQLVIFCKKNEIGMENFPMTLDSSDENDEVINRKTSTTRQQVNRPSS